MPILGSSRFGSRVTRVQELLVLPEFQVLPELSAQSEHAWLMECVLYSVFICEEKGPLAECCTSWPGVRDAGGNTFVSVQGDTP